MILVCILSDFIISIINSKKKIYGSFFFLNKFVLPVHESTGKLAAYLRELVTRDGIVKALGVVSNSGALSPLEECELRTLADKACDVKERLVTIVMQQPVEKQTICQGILAALNDDDDNNICLTSECNI